MKDIILNKSKFSRAVTMLLIAMVSATFRLDASPHSHAPVLSSLSATEWLLRTDRGLYSVFPANVTFDFIDCGSVSGMIKQPGNYYFGGYRWALPLVQVLGMFCSVVSAFKWLFLKNYTKRVVSPNWEYITFMAP